MLGAETFSWQKLTKEHPELYRGLGGEPGEVISPEERRAILAERPPAIAPTPEEYRRYEQLPLIQQLMYEAPFWGVAMTAPSATAFKARLLPIIARGGAKATAAKALVGALRPVVATERVQTRALNAAAAKLKGIKA
ncbi:unnamed protein product [marine sediment metagenome]|uniref:Uncharacterized protein n=1 Tax=marine sediment metagenome TaxID=412755 RepID=X1IBN6_9ZZZZ